MDVGDWLRNLGLGLEQYEALFRESDIDPEVLPELTDQHLKDLGVSFGHRLKMLRAIREMARDAPVKAQPSPPAGPKPQDAAERRQLTVMFCDLVGSTALSARLDPEDMREIIGSYHRCCAKMIERNGGFVAKYMGDGVLTYFGYPQAHEHDAERAVQAGLAIVEAAPTLVTSAGSPLHVRVGIATGLVVVGDLIGSGDSQERGVVGETPNLAARLQAIAEPDMVVIAEGTRRLLGNLFELRDLGAKDLKGIAGPARAWAALRPSSVESRFEALHTTGLTALVGREEEFEWLLRRWSKAKDGEGQVVLLSGEAGIGKSRLTAALLERLAGEPHTRLRYFCSPQHTDSALYPIIGQMERAAGLTRDDVPKAKLDRLDAVLVQTATSIEDAALLAEMLSLPNDGRYPALDLDPPRRRQKTLEALVSQMEALARQSPVLVIFEDAHWTDPTSLEAFGRTVERIAGLRVLLIVTFRPEFEPPWIGRPHVTALSINRMTRREIDTMIDRVAGNNLLSVSLRQDIIERTDGIPLFLEEMTKAVLEAGSESAAERAVAAISTPALAVPASLHASLMARLDRLGSAKEIAQIGAAIGREFSHALLAAVVRKPEADLGAALDRLIAAGLLFRQGAPPHATYLFKHALVQDAAYGTLLRGRRQQLHSIIANVLETLFAETSKKQPGKLAHHFTEAGITERAIDYWIEAGRQARRRSAMAEAEALLRKGLTLVSTLPNSVSRQERELDLQIVLGQTLYATQGFGATSVGEAYARSRQLCDQLNRPRQLFAAVTGQWTHHQLRAELDRAQQLAAELRELSDVMDDVSTRSAACRVSGFTCLFLGDFAASRVYLERSLALRDSVEQRPSGELATVEMLIAILGPLSWTLACSGHLDQAQSRCNAALVEARRLSHAHTLAIALWWAWGVGWIARSQPSGLFLYADELHALATEARFPYYRALALLARGWCLAAVGQGDQGIPLLTTGLADLRATETGQFMPAMLTILADAHRIVGRPQLGLTQLAEAERLAEATQERLVAAETLRIKADLLILTDNRISAEASLRHAITLARDQEAKQWQLRAATSLARLWRDQGKRTEAHDLLAPIYGWFTEGFNTLDLKEAKALLDALAS
jgi:class 3 adenylate cyclase